jgi:CO/xanthine dehydrogenase FAD-binding subunit
MSVATNATAEIPHTLDEALAARASHTCRPIAGGTDLVVRHRRAARVPVDIGSPALFIGMVPELRAIECDGNELVIGAAVTLSMLERSGDLPAEARALFLPVLAEFACPAVRTLATVGGNVCNASPAADLLPLFYAHDATVDVASARARRSVSIGAMISGPGETALADDELVTAVRIPYGSIGPTGDAPAVYRFYRKVAARRSNALSKLSVYVRAVARDGALENVRIALGAVAPTVVRLPDVETELAGADAGTLVARAPEAIDAYRRACRPIDDQRSSAEYRRETAIRLVRFVLEEDLPGALQAHTRTEEL